MSSNSHQSSSSTAVPALKKRRLTQIQQKYSLPIELIVKIFTHLDNFEEFKKCWGLCKEIRDYIFKTPLIMRKIVFHFSDWKEIESFPLPNERFELFLQTRGKYVLKIVIKFFRFSIGLKTLRKILNLLSNIEQFCFFANEKNEQMMELKNSENSCEEELLDIPNLPKLTHLRITHRFLEIFIGKVTNLRHLQIGEAQGDAHQTRNITSFMNQQKNLKGFSLINSEYELKRYTMDLKVPFQFHLKTFSCDRECENFPEFCELLADDLEEMYLYMQPNPPFLDALEKFKKLKTLRLPIRSDEDFFTSDYKGWELKTVENFQPIFTAKLSKVLSRFPNVKSIQCSKLEKDSGTFETIETVNVDYFDPEILDTVKLPNWKTLVVTERVEEAEWKEVVAILPKIEIKLTKELMNV